LPETVNDYLLRAGRLPDGGLRFVDRGEQATWVGWGEVRERALAVAAGLLAAGAGRGDRVALVFPTGVEFFAAFFGALLAGAVPVSGKRVAVVLSGANVGADAFAALMSS